jgi:hypothetical protein
MQLLDDYQQWKLDNPDEGYQYDMIHEFLAQHGRGDLQDLLEIALSFKEKADKWDKLGKEIGKFYEENDVDWDSPDAEYEDEGEFNLIDIGEITAIAFGYL